MIEECVVEDCGRSVQIKSAQMCRRCYQRAYKKGEHPKAKRWVNDDGSRAECNLKDCSEPVKCKGLCNKHYQAAQTEGLPRQKSGPKPIWVNADGSRKECAVDECEKPVQSRGLCVAHITRVYRHGSLDLRGRVYPKCPTPGCGRTKTGEKDLCFRCSQFRWRYGLTTDQVIELHLPENRECSIPGCDTGSRIVMDHDHACCSTGKWPRQGQVSCGRCLRGWLCNHCNQALGMVRDRTDKLEGLIRYLGQPYLLHDKTPAT